MNPYVQALQRANAILQLWSFNFYMLIIAEKSFASHLLNSSINQRYFSNDLRYLNLLRFNTFIFNSSFCQKKKPEMRFFMSFAHLSLLCPETTLKCLHIGDLCKQRHTSFQMDILFPFHYQRFKVHGVQIVPFVAQLTSPTSVTWTLLVSF